MPSTPPTQTPTTCEKLERLLVLGACPACGGTRLRPEARAVRVAGQGIVEVTRLPLDELAAWIGGLKTSLPAEEWLVAEPIAADLQERVRRLVEIGPGLPDPRARHSVALGGRGAAAAAGGIARLRADRRALRPG